MAKLEFVEEPFGPDPDPAPKCEKGVHGHRWVLTVEEGRPVLDLAEGEECPTYPFYGGDPSSVCRESVVDFLCNGPESLSMNFSVPVRLEFNVEHYGRYGEEVDVWLEVHAE